MRRAQWAAGAGVSLSLNVAPAASIRETLAHLSEEPVDVIVVGPLLDDGTRDELFDALATRTDIPPVIAIGGPDGAAPVDTLGRGAVEALADDDVARLGAIIARAVRDAQLGRALRAAHDELHAVLAASDRHSFMLANAPAMVWSTDETLTLRAVDGAAAVRTMPGIPVAIWDPEAGETDRSRIVEAHRRALAGGTVTLRAKWHGRPRYLTVAPVREGAAIVGVIGTALEIADGPADGALFAPQHDSVTDLPNRAVFEQRVTLALANAERVGEPLAVLFVDVDRFKTVNDLGGHAAGDAVLRAIAHRLHGAIGEQDAIARFSADEFVVLSVAINDPEAAQHLAARILASFETPFAYGEHEFHLTASVGVSFGPNDADDAATLIARAESALFEAKRMGRNVVRRYVPSLLATPSERHVLQRELLHAIERDQLDLVYQPVFETESGALVSFEALVRWRHPSLGTIVPDRFIPMAEESGLIDRIGEWVVERACAQIRAWCDQGLVDVRVSVNVSARQLERLGLQRFIGETVRAYGIDPAALEIEVTETSILRDVYAATVLLRGLRELGVRVAIDDFGAGFTSLAFLRDLPIDDLKIDRSFVRDIATGVFDLAVVRAVVGLARSLGVRTIAEGVEHPAQLKVLRELHCDAVQGYLLSAPLAPADCAAVLQRRIA